MTQFIDELKKTLSQLKKQTENLGQTVTTIRDRIMLLEAEHSTILDRPLTKEDMLELILGRLDKTAEKEDSRWATHFSTEAQARHRGVSTRSFSVAHVRRAAKGDVEELHDSWLNQGNILPPEYRPLTSEAVFSLFREPIKEAVRRYFAGIEWPYPDAQPAETNFARLDEIEAELADLREQEALMVSQAKELGVTIPAPYDMGGSRWN